MAFIYVITNDINGKQYVGKTERTIEARFKEHCKDKDRRGLEKRPLYRAMNKYGVEHFHIEALEETTESEERESYWIARLNTFENGYNATKGGDGKHYLDYDLIANTYLELQNIAAVCSKLQVDKATVRKVLIQYNIPIKSSQEITREKTSKPVAQYDLNGNLIVTYNSIADAARDGLGDLATHRHIGEVCHNKRKTAYGYRWQFINTQDVV